MPNKKWDFKSCKEVALKCKSKSEFQKRFASAYNACHYRGWFDIVCTHMKSGYVKWTFEECKKEAKKYSSRLQFDQGSKGCYQAALRNQWMDKICAHMLSISDKKKILQSKWTFSFCCKEAKKYKNRTSFKRNSFLVYKFAQNKGWLDKVCRHIPKYGISFEECKSQALGCKTKTQFYTKHHKAYMAAQRNGWLTKVCDHMEGSKWSNVETIKQEALKYNKRSDFFKYSPGAYAAAKTKGKLNVFCKHMITRSEACSKAKKIWTLDKIIKVSKKFDIKSDFRENESGAYASAQKMGVLTKVCSHMKKRGTNLWTKENIHQEAKKYNKRSVFSKQSPGAYSAALRLKILDNVCAHMISLAKACREGQLKWTKDKVIKEALKHKTKDVFRRKAPGAYASARNLGILNEVRNHMVATNKWQKNKIFKEAKKYKKRSQFQRNAIGAYVAARKMGIINKACSHMPEFANSDRLEEKVDHPKYKKLFQKLKLSYSHEYLLGTKRIDFVIQIGKEKIGVEIKNDKMSWSKNKLNKQISLYRKLGNLCQYSIDECLISSLKGKYGMSIKELEIFIKRKQRINL